MEYNHNMDDKKYTSSKITYGDCEGEDCEVEGWFSSACPEGRGRGRETLELNQLKYGPSQLLPVFSEFDRFFACFY